MKLTGPRWQDDAALAAYLGVGHALGRVTGVKLQVTDDSGFLALIDPDAYSGFVAESWDLEDVLARFREQMAAHHLLIWGTGQEGCWTVQVWLSRRPESGVREVAGSIVSTRGRLLLTNYEV